MATIPSRRTLLLSALTACTVLLTLTAGRNYVTGAKLSPELPVHVVSVGEHMSYHVAPNSHRPSNYVQVSGTTWVSWGDESSWGYGRVSARWPGNLLGGDSGWARIEVSCPVESDGKLHYNRYELEWLDGDHVRDMDGWERDEVTLLPGKECVDT